MSIFHIYRETNLTLSQKVNITLGSLVEQTFVGFDTPEVNANFQGYHFLNYGEEEF